MLLDGYKRVGQITGMSCSRVTFGAIVASLLTAAGCGDRSRSSAGSTQALPPVYPGAPVANTGWDADAGPIVITPLDNSTDTVAVVVPETTDSTVSIVKSLSAPVSRVRFDLFGRGGRIASAVRSVPLPPVDTSRQACHGWPLARLLGRQEGWTVGLESGRARPIPLDSIEAFRSSDSAALAASLAQAAATLPNAADPTFRGLPFRVRSAFTFAIDSVEAVIADVVRTVNQEANPRIEHLLIIGERPVGSSAPYSVRYSNRTAGSEESAQASELLAVLSIGKAKRPALVINTDYGEGNRLAILERFSDKWQPVWRSAYTDC